MRRTKQRPGRRQGSGYAPEFLTLEGRTLLSHVKPAIATAAAAEIQAEAYSHNATVITGKIVGFKSPAALLTKNIPGFSGFSGHGTSRQVGAVFLGFQHLATPQSPTDGNLVLSNGRGLLTTIFGEKIDLTYTGLSTVSGRVTNSLSLTGTVNSGTGQFSGDTGTFVATGTDNITLLGRFSLSFTITLTKPTV